MNKKIIIDGVDVTGCTWCDFEPDAKPYCRINDGEDLGCEDNPNCYYKQLQRKTTECEKYEQALLRIRRLELEELDIDFDEYITHVREADYSPILTEVAKVLGDIEND